MKPGSALLILFLAAIAFTGFTVVSEATDDNPGIEPTVIESLR